MATKTRKELALEELLKDPDANVRLKAAAAIDRIDARRERVKNGVKGRGPSAPLRDDYGIKDPAKLQDFLAVLQAEKEGWKPEENRG